MSETLVGTIITAVSAGALAIILLWMQNKQATAMAKLTFNQEAVHKQINSRMDELLELTRKSSKAEGKAEEKAETKAKTDES